MQILIDNSIIPLPPGINLPLVMRSPLFATSENKIPGSYIFNTLFPATEILRSIFNQAHRVQRHGRATAELPYIINDGSLRFAGNSIVTEASKDNYEISFKIDNGDFAGKIAGKTLKDLDLGGDITMTKGLNEVGVNTERTYYAVDAVAYFTVTIPIVITNIAADFTDSHRLQLGDTSFQAPEADTYHFALKVSVHEMTTPVKLRVYKNSILFEEIEMNMPPYNTYVPVESLITASWDLEKDDILTFFWYAMSVPLSGHAVIRLNILANYTLSIRVGSKLFIDEANGNQDTSDFVVFPIHNIGFLDNFPDDAFQIDNLSLKTIYTSYFPVLNYFKNGEFPVYLGGNMGNSYVTCANFFTPFLYLNTLLNKIINESGYSVINSPFGSKFKNAVLFNAYAENTYNTPDTTLLPIKNTLNLSDHVPEIKQSDFLNWISMLTGFFPVVDNNTNTITFIDIKDKNILKTGNRAIAWPGILLPNPVVKVDPEYKGIKFELKKAGADKYLERIKELNPKLNYKGVVHSVAYLPPAGNKVNDLYLVTVPNNEYWVFQYNAETYTLTWCFFSENWPLIYTEGEEPYLSITTELCPVLTNKMPDETLGAPVNRTWLIPKTEQSGILEGFPDSLGSEYGLQVLYYKGMVNDSLSQPYPLGSSRLANYASNPDLSPDLSADGIYNERYKGFMKWLAYDAKPATYKTILTRSQLKSIKYGQVYAGDGFNFLLKELRINLQADGLSVAEVDIYTC